MIFAVDFDGTLVEHKFPEMGEPNVRLINKLKKLKRQGHSLVLWTCREGEYLTEAVNFCRAFNLIFDSVNDNVPDAPYKNFENPSRKIFADLYIDDKAILPENFLEIKNDTL